MTHTHTHTDVSIESPNEMPVSEGSTLVIYCKTGLLDSRSVQSTFRHLDHEVQCNSVNVNSGDSTWVVNRTNHQPYTCTLYIESIQPLDSGDYYCDVGEHNPLQSSPLRVEVAAVTSPTSATHPTSDKLILWTTIPIVGAILITGLILVVVYKVYSFTASRHHHEDSLCKMDTLTIHCKMTQTIVLTLHLPARFLHNFCDFFLLWFTWDN